MVVWVMADTYATDNSDTGLVCQVGVCEKACEVAAMGHRQGMVVAGAHDMDDGGTDVVHLVYVLHEASCALGPVGTRFQHLAARLERPSLPWGSSPLPAAHRDLALPTGCCSARGSPPL